MIQSADGSPDEPRERSRPGSGDGPPFGPSDAVIGVPGVAWGEAERLRWRRSRVRRRSYADDVVRRVEALSDRFDVDEYGAVTDGDERHRMFALRTRRAAGRRPALLVTGGVHGYETSGVLGALAYLERHAEEHGRDLDVIVAPCVSPWSYERIQRWNASAVDPNRSFHPGSDVVEAVSLMDYVSSLGADVLVHVDLHETTDTDETEFRPMLAARDGIRHTPGEIPDGFYLCGDTERPALGFQAALIAAVARVTHIAEPDATGAIIGTPIAAPGVILYPLRHLGLCAGMTDAPWRTTTEVYPDSPRTMAQACVEAQVAAVCAAVAHARVVRSVSGGCP